MGYNFDNDPNFRIAIYIGGNIERGNGFGQIVSVGLLAGMEYEKLDAPPISRANTKENPVFTIKNTEAYVLYKIWDDSVLISDDMNDGRLCIGMTIPSNARLKDSKQSPYTLLMRIRDKFFELGTNPTEDGRRRFKKVELKKEDFQAIIDEYPIEYVQNCVVPMTGNRRGQLQITSIKDMEDFFRDTQYEEFTEYEAIEVTTQGLNMFPNLRIPKPKGYQIVVNEQLVTVKDSTNKEKVKILWEGNDEQFIARCDSTLDYRYEPLTISIDKLRKAFNATQTSQDGNSKAVLDENSQSIICTLNPIAKWYYKDVKYDLNSDDAAEKYCKENLGKRIKIRVDGQEWNDDKIQPSRVVEQKKDVKLRKGIFSISPEETEDYRFSVSDVALLDAYDGKKLCVLYIKAEKKRTSNRKNGNKQPSDSGLDIKSLLIGAAIGIALGVAGFWAVQTLLNNNKGKKIEKKARESEEVAWNKLKDLTPKNPKQAMQFRDYLRAFSNGEITISKGDDVPPEKINGKFAYADGSHINSVKKKLQKYVTDSIQAERDEEEAFEKCTDTIACNNYLKAYKSVQDHQYFEKGKHVDKVLKKKAELKEELKQADANAKAEQARSERQAKETNIKNAVKTKALEYLNSKDLNGFRTWLNGNNGDWKTEIGGKKTNKDLLGKDNVNAVEWILGYKDKNATEFGGPVDKKGKVPEIEKSLEGKTFNSWDDVTKAKKRIDEILKNRE